MFINRLAEIETFVAIAELGSFAAVAEQRGIAVSAISRRLNELESRLSVKLAVRNSRGLTLNPSGREYYRQCLRILSDIEAMDSDIACAKADHSGLIRIAVPRAFGIGFLSPLINEYAISWPGIRFDLDVSDGMVDLAEGRYDFAVRIGQKLDDRHFTSTVLVPIQHLVSASPAFWRVYGTPKKPSDIEGFPALAYRMGVESAIWKYANRNRRTGTVRLTPRYISNSGDFLVKAAIDGLGVILEPFFVCGEAIQEGLLTSVLREFTWYESNVHLIQPAEGIKNRCAAAFAEFIVKKSKDSKISEMNI